MKQLIGKTRQRRSQIKTNSGGQKKKRERTLYSQEDLKILENYFDKNPYLDQQTRNTLGTLLGYPADRLKVWYQNRRMRVKRNWVHCDSEATAEVCVSSSEDPTKRQIIAKINSRRRNKSGGTYCGNSHPTLPKTNSVDIQMSNSQDSASYTSDKYIPNAANVGVPPPWLDDFRPTEPNPSVFHASLQTPPRIQGIVAKTPQPAHNSQSYTYMNLSNDANVGFPPPKMDARINAYAPIPPTIQGSAPTIPQLEILKYHLSHYVNSPYLATPLTTNRANKFNSSMYHATVSSSQNFEYQAPYSHRIYSNYGAMRSNQQVDSPSHIVYERGNSEIHNIGADFDSSQFRSLANRSACFTGNNSTRQRNPHETQQSNTIKTESLSSPLRSEDSGSSQHTNHSVRNHSVRNHSVRNHSVPNHSVPNHSVPNHSVPNHLNLHRNPPPPGITADTSNSTIPTHPNSFSTHPSSFPAHPSSFPAHPSSFPAHPSSFPAHPSSFPPHPSSFQANPSQFNQASYYNYLSQSPASGMFQNFHYGREYFPEQDRFLVPPNINFPRSSDSEAPQCPTSLDYSSTMADENNYQNSNSCSLDRSGISLCQELSGRYMNSLSPKPSTESSYDEPDDDRDPPSWGPIFSILRNLEGTADLECSAQPTNSTTSYSFS